MAAEVSLAPNLLSLYGCQGLYWLRIAKTPSPVTEIRRIRSTSGQHSSWHLYLPNRPGYLLVKRVSQATASLSAQPPGCSARVTGITGLDKLICPTAPDICSRNVAFKSQLPGYLFAKWRPKVTTTRMVCSFYLKYRSIVFSTVSVSSGFAFVS